MAKIEFLPVCSNCGRVIYDTVTIKVEKNEVYPGVHLYTGRSELSPARCPHCDERFNTIIMHTLPYHPKED